MSEVLAVPSTSPEQHWHLDRKVPITIVIALAIQTLTFIYVGTAWKTEVEYRIISLEKANEERKSQEGRIIAMEQKLQYITEGVRRIENKIDTAKDAPTP